MVTRRRFTADFKARVALEALRGDKTIQEIATKHKVSPPTMRSLVSSSNQPSFLDGQRFTAFLTLSSPNGISSSDQNSVCRNFRSATAAVIALLPRSCDRTSTVHLRS